MLVNNIEYKLKAGNEDSIICARITTNVCIRNASSSCEFIDQINVFNITINHVLKILVYDITISSSLVVREIHNNIII